MRIDVLTLFPGMFRGPLEESILRRAQERGLVSIALHNLREYGLGRHRQVDDYPYGGGPGMVLRPEPIFRAVDAIQAGLPPGIPVTLLSPQGRTFRQDVAQEMARRPNLLLICGHYEGLDERIREHLVTEEISLGDFILTGGELGALVVVDAVVRLVPGVIAAEAEQEESFTQGLLEYPQYTRPRDFRGWPVPEVLLSGDHREVARWRRRRALLRTLERRPDLLARASLTEEEKAFLKSRGYTG